MTPVTPDTKRPKKIKHSRLPNGFGSITTLSGNRRNPFWARKTTGFDRETGFPIYETIGYFPEWILAFQALSDYNRNPYDLALSRLTFSQVYEKWSARKFNEVKNGKMISESSRVSYRAAFKHCSAIHNMNFSELNTLHLQKVMDECVRGRSTLENIKNLYIQLYKYAMEFNIVQKDYSAFVIITKSDTASTKRPFSDQEVRSIWPHQGTDGADMALILLYSGMRISEMLGMTAENIHLDDGYMQGGVKTDAGINRIIPIHSSIMDIVQRRMAQNEKLFDFPQDYYAREEFKDFLARLGMIHLPHECRHTFISKADTVGMNDTALKMIVGHAKSGVTQKVYTHKTITELSMEMEKIRY